MVASVSLGRLLKGGFSNFVHHFAVLRRELVFDLSFELGAVFATLGHFQECLRFEKLAQVLADVFHSRLAPIGTFALLSERLL